MSNTTQARRAIAQNLEAGLTHHRSGQLLQAADCYRRILSANPLHPDALNLSGVLARQSGDLERSERLIRQAITQNRNAATYHHNLGRTLVLLNRGKEARQSFSRALKLNGSDLESMEHLLPLLTEPEDLPQAIALCRSLTHLRPDTAAHQLQLTRLLHRSGDLPAALASAQSAVRLFPVLADAHFNLADLLASTPSWNAAADAYQAGLALAPQNAEAHNSLGGVLHHAGHRESAKECYRRAIAVAPRLVRACLNLGIVCMELNQFAEGEAALRRALALQPDCLEAYANLGALLDKKGDAVGAVNCLQHVLTRDPRHVPALVNLGLTLDHLGDETGASACYELALTLKPDAALARYNRSIHLLSNGSFAEGWLEYEHRWTTRDLAMQRPSADKPEWQGEPLAGRTILLYAEQGLGDTIQFARFIPMVAALGATVLLQVQPPVYNLLRTLPGVSRLLLRGDPLPPYEVQCALLSLPRIFATDSTNIPALDLRPVLDPVRLASWQQSFSQQPGLRVGLVWAGNPTHTRDRQRSIPLTRFAPLLNLEGIAFHALQKGPACSQLSLLPPALQPAHLEEKLVDLTDTAAAIANLDLVLTVDTAVAHLAGSLGVPVWILLPHTADWRWLKQRSDTPWYPTARLFRQPAANDWDSTLEEVAVALEALVASRAG